MQNVKMKVNKKTNKLTIEVDLTQNFGLSASGKSETVASTKGNKDIGYNDIKIGLNVYKPVKNANRIISVS